MIIIPHLLTGAAIAIKANNPAIGLFFAFLSHYALDSIPHQEYKIRNIIEKKWRNSLPDFLKIAMDFSFGVFLIFFLSKNFTLAFTGGLISNLPDFLTFLHYVFPGNKILEKHYIFHRKTIHPAAFNKGGIYFMFRIFTQIFISLIAIFFLLK